MYVELEEKIYMECPLGMKNIKKMTASFWKRAVRAWCKQEAMY